MSPPKETLTVRVFLASWRTTSFIFFVGWPAFDDSEDLELEPGLGVFLVGPWDRWGHNVEDRAIDGDVHIAEVGIQIFISRPSSSSQIRRHCCRSIVVLLVIFEFSLSTCISLWLYLISLSHWHEVLV